MASMATTTAAMATTTTNKASTRRFYGKSALAEMRRASADFSVPEPGDSPSSALR